MRTKDWRFITAVMPTTVTMMLIVPTPRDHFTARVIRDTQEMESTVQVKDSVHGRQNKLSPKLEEEIDYVDVKVQI